MCLAGCLSHPRRTNQHHFPLGSSEPPPLCSHPWAQQQHLPNGCFLGFLWRHLDHPNIHPTLTFLCQWKHTQSVRHQFILAMIGTNVTWLYLWLCADTGGPAVSGLEPWPEQNSISVHWGPLLGWFRPQRPVLSEWRENTVSSCILRNIIRLKLSLNIQIQAYTLSLCPIIPSNPFKVGSCVTFPRLRKPTSRVLGHFYSPVSLHVFPDLTINEMSKNCTWQYTFFLQISV